MINGTLCSQTPVQVIILLWAVSRTIALITIAQTASTTGLATTVVIGNHIVFLISRVIAGTDPGQGRHFCAGRTGTGCATTTTAQKTINGAKTPVFTLSGITRILRIARILWCNSRVTVPARRGPCYRQQGICCCTNNCHTKLGNEASSGRLPCDSSAGLFTEFV